MSATAAQAKTADRVYNRAPKGGILCPLSGRFFKGGQFCFLYTAEQLAAIAKPAPLTGSSRQISWATRLRTTWLARLDAKLAELRGQIAAMDRAADRKDGAGAGIRAEVKRLEGKKWRLWVEGDAATIVGRHVARGLAGSGMGGLRLAVVA